MLDAVGNRFDAIYRLSLGRWGQPQAGASVKELFEAFDYIESRGVVSRPIPAEFGLQGYHFRCGKYLVYWKYLTTGDIGISTILHERMHRVGRFKDEFEL